MGAESSRELCALDTSRSLDDLVDDGQVKLRPRPIFSHVLSHFSFATCLSSEFGPPRVIEPSAISES